MKIADAALIPAELTDLSSFRRWADSDQYPERGEFHFRFSHVAADISIQPDLVFVSYESIQQGRVKLVRGQLGGHVELEGSPELVVEIVSPSSVRKDTEVLRELYALAGVAEYWLIDARSTSPTLEILQLAGKFYQPVAKSAHGQSSQALAREIALTQDTDPLGNPRYQFRMDEPSVAN